VIGEDCDWYSGTAHIYNDDLRRIDPETSDVIVIEGVPSETQEGLGVGCFVEDCGMVEGASIEETDGTFCTD
jgi:hypothetical protein